MDRKGSSEFKMIAMAKKASHISIVTDITEVKRLEEIRELESADVTKTNDKSVSSLEERESPVSMRK